MPTIDLNKHVKSKPKSFKATEKPSSFDIIEFLNKDIQIGSKDLADRKKEFLYLELSSLLQAGIDFKVALDLILSDQKKNKDKQLFEMIKDAVISGLSFSTALDKTGRFSTYEIFSVQIGEETGKLTEVLQQLANFYRNKIKQRRKIVSALTYPTIVVATSIGAIFFMLKFVVPMFGDVFKRFGGTLPWITQKIIFLSEALEKLFPVFITYRSIAILIVIFLQKDRSVPSDSLSCFTESPVRGQPYPKDLPCPIL